MNYDHLNQVYDYWRKDIRPYLSHNFTVTSFDDYLKRFAYLPSGHWLREMELVRLNRLGFAIDPEKFVKRYKDACISYNAPMKPEDGIQRIIYQLSPTLHVEMALWVWMEQEVVQSYGSVFACYHVEEEFAKFTDELYHKMLKKGNTEDKRKPAGFADFLRKADEESA